MTVPVSIFLYALQHKVVSPVKLYLFLKYATSGHFHFSKENVKTITDSLGWKSTKTFGANLAWLIQHKWVTVNNPRHSLRIVGYDQILRMIRKNPRSAAEMQPEDFNYFRPFAYAVAITWAMGYKWGIERKSALKKGSARKSFRPPIAYSMPLRYLSIILRVDYTTISKYKTRAKEAGYLYVNKQYSVIDMTPADAAHLNAIVKEPPRHLVTYRGVVYEQLADLIESTVRIRRFRHRPRTRPP